MSRDVAIPSNSQRLLWAGFFSIFAAGVGFSVRAGILIPWRDTFGFTMAELGLITGGGLLGFGIIIIIGSLIADTIGYGKLMAFAFVMHVLSAILPLFAPFVFEWGGPEQGKNLTLWLLYVAMFMFAIGNGMGEVVVNPMVAALFPTQKTHYLNILHAGWPGGLIAGGLVSYFMNSGSLLGWVPFPDKIHWMIQMSMFLIPTVLYGVFKNRYPYGPGLIVYDYARGTSTPLVDGATAQRYFARANPGRDSGCPAGIEGLGTQLLPWGNR